MKIALKIIFLFNLLSGLLLVVYSIYANIRGIGLDSNYGWNGLIISGVLMITLTIILIQEEYY